MSLRQGDPFTVNELVDLMSQVGIQFIPAEPRRKSEYYLFSRKFHDTMYGIKVFVSLEYVAIYEDRNFEILVRIGEYQEDKFYRYETFEEAFGGFCRLTDIFYIR